MLFIQILNHCVYVQSIFGTKIHQTRMHLLYCVCVYIFIHIYIYIYSLHTKDAGTVINIFRRLRQMAMAVRFYGGGMRIYRHTRA